MAEEEIKDDDSSDWFSSASKRIERENEKRKAKKELEKIEKNEQRIKDLKNKKAQVKVGS